MEELLHRLREYVNAKPEQCYFGPAATEEAIAAVEALIGMPLPADYRKFLCCFDGGYISLCGRSGDSDWDEPTARWNSNDFFGVERLAAEFAEQKEIWQLDQEWDGPWPYLPFCHTDGQELIVFGPVGGEDRPVLDAFHEVGPSEWRPLYPNFRSLLRAYLDGEGRIQTIAGSQA